MQNSLHRIRIQVVASVLGMLCLVVVTPAALRPRYSDEQIVSRAELIVVGKMKEGSLVFVPQRSASGISWEHHLELLIAEVLKGQTSGTAKLVSVKHGLTPLVGGCFSNQFAIITAVATNYAKDSVIIFDTGSSTRPLMAITGDIRTNHIWLLRHEPAQGGNSNILSVYDPEDIQPLARRAELLKHLK